MIRKAFISISLIILFTMVLAGDADKGEYVQNLAHGNINWTKQFVYANGSGAPDLKAPNVAVARLGAERAAKLDAMRNLLEAIQGMNVTGSTTVKNSMETSMDVKTQIDGVVKGMEVVTTKYFSDGGVDVVVRVPISSVSDKVRDAGSADAAVSNKEAVVMKQEAPKAEGGDKKDVLVLDVRGSKFTPALFPVIYTDDGKIVYSKKQVKEDVLKTKGMIHYIKDDLESVKNLYGESANSLVVKVKNIKNKSDMVLGGGDISVIQSKLTADTFGEGKVVILF